MTVLYTEITELIKCLPLFLYSDIKALTDHMQIKSQIS